MPRPIDNPPNPWSASEVEWLGPAPDAKLEVYEERARTALSRNESDDVPFRFSVNPYRGCIHGCAYCYARPTHHYLGFGAGTDFDRRIVVKTNIAERLAFELDKARWSGESIALSGNTDCYQPLESHYELTRRCLEVLVERENPFAIITKSALVARDVDLIAEGARYADIVVTISLPFIDDATAGAIEPWAARPQRRLDAMKRLADAGVVVCVAIAPLIVGLNDEQVPLILERARAAGAQRAFMVPLRLPPPVDDVFEDRLRAALPQRADKVMNGIREVRAGRLTDNRVGTRMSGLGPRWTIARKLFEQRSKKLGYDMRSLDELSALNVPAKAPAKRKGQLPLF